MILKAILGSTAFSKNKKKYAVQSVYRCFKTKDSTPFFIYSKYVWIDSTLFFLSRYAQLSTYIATDYFTRYQRKNVFTFILVSSLEKCYIHTLVLCTHSWSNDVFGCHVYKNGFFLCLTSAPEFKCFHFWIFDSNC